EIGAHLRLGAPPGLVEKDPLPPHGGQAELGAESADLVEARTGRHEGRRGVRAERASARVFADRAFHGRELDAEIGLRQDPPGLLRKADVVDAVKAHEVEERLRRCRPGERDSHRYDDARSLSARAHAFFAPSLTRWKTRWAFPPRILPTSSGR